LKTSELIKKLKNAGFIKGREGGRHTIYDNPVTGQSIAVSRHAKEIPTGTAEKILKQAGIKK
jgi:predicted RNA binding protein YcfA (HicA-like mRNA interferase family)